MPAIKVQDPVCGMEIPTSEARGESDYQGKDYYFCSISCMNDFKKNPQRYIPARAISPAERGPKQKNL